MKIWDPLCKKYSTFKATGIAHYTKHRGFLSVGPRKVDRSHVGPGRHTWSLAQTLVERKESKGW